MNRLEFKKEKGFEQLKSIKNSQVRSVTKKYCSVDGATSTISPNSFFEMDSEWPQENKKEAQKMERKK